MPRKVTLKVQNRTGFDKSFQNLLTMKCGTLVPLLCDEVIPNTTVNLGLAISAALPPLASDTFMRCQLRAEAFFVPFRLLCGGYQYWQTRQEIGPANNKKVPVMPYCINMSAVNTSAGTLMDYLGVKQNTAEWSINDLRFSLLKPLAYHRVYDDWYRNTLVQQPLFFPYLYSTSRGQDYVEHIPYVANVTSGYNLTGVGLTRLTFQDGKTLFDLRQRNFDTDYFTNAKPSPQLGTAQKVGFTIADSQGSFTIADLRAANSIQQFLERNNLIGYRLQDYVKGQYGADLSDGVAQRSLYLGSASYDVYSKGIFQSSQNNEASISTRNPFGSTGSIYGSANASGSGSLIHDFTANESGFIFVMISLVPKVTYSSGIDRGLLRYTAAVGTDDRSDMANPILQNIGNEPIYGVELYGALQGGLQNVFGYTDRYSSFMTKQDELHGLVRDGQSLESFALQRSFDSSVSNGINSSFLQIPTDYLDQVAAVDGQISQYGCWVDSWLNYKVVQPLARYSIPSLQDPAYEHGHDVTISEGGSRIA